MKSNQNIYVYQLNNCVEMRPKLGRISFTRLVHRSQGIAVCCYSNG